MALSRSNASNYEENINRDAKAKATGSMLAQNAQTKRRCEQ